VRPVVRPVVLPVVRPPVDRPDTEHHQGQHEAGREECEKEPDVAPVHDRERRDKPASRQPAAPFSGGWRASTGALTGMPVG
jgi:hypothetical protein